MSTWTPGQHVLPGLVEARHRVSALAIIVVVAVFSVLGLFGWFALYQAFGFPAADHGDRAGDRRLQRVLQPVLHELLGRRDAAVRRRPVVHPHGLAAARSQVVRRPAARGGDGGAGRRQAERHHHRCRCGGCRGDLRRQGVGEAGHDPQAGRGRRDHRPDGRDLLFCLVYARRHGGLDLDDRASRRPAVLCGLRRGLAVERQPVAARPRQLSLPESRPAGPPVDRRRRLLLLSIGRRDVRRHLGATARQPRRVSAVRLCGLCRNARLLPAHLDGGQIGELRRTAFQGAVAAAFHRDRACLHDQPLLAAARSRSPRLPAWRASTA